VGNESDLLLAIRTIAVSARAAVTSNNKVGRPDLAAESARRGLMLLEGLRDQLDAGVPGEAHQHFDAAIRELTSAAAGEDAEVNESTRPGGRPERNLG
jgi:hypothetical protein